jgi:ribosomal protein S19E (S16A)
MMFYTKRLLHGFIGISMIREAGGGVMRAKPAKHFHSYPLSREIPRSLLHSLQDYAIVLINTKISVLSCQALALLNNKENTGCIQAKPGAFSPFHLFFLLGQVFPGADL